MTFLRWLNEVRKQLTALITGSLLLGGLGLYQEVTGHQVPVWVYGLAVIGFLGWAFFGAWQKQYSESEQARARCTQLETKIYDGRPVFVLDLRHQSGNLWSFYLKNCGERAARYVRLGTQKSFAQNYELHFSEIALLESLKEAMFVSWWVSKVHSLDGKSLDNEMLLKFLNDVPSGAEEDDPLQRAVFIWFDVPITYRDMNEVPAEAVVRFCFDLESQLLKAAAVPYTERRVDCSAN